MPSVARSDDRKYNGMISTEVVQRWGGCESESDKQKIRVVTYEEQPMPSVQNNDDRKYNEMISKEVVQVIRLYMIYDLGYMKVNKNRFLCLP